MKTLLIYLKNIKKPIQIIFESKTKLDKFYEELNNNETTFIEVGPLTFMKSELICCLQK